MKGRLESIEVFVRKLPPSRMEFQIGAKKPGTGTAPILPRRPGALLLARVEIEIDGRRVTGCSGDRPSFGWLDKRPAKPGESKLDGLLDLIETSRKIWLEEGRAFESPFELWLRCYKRVHAAGKALDHEDLTSSFATALFERAVIDAMCKARGKSFFEMARDDQLGFDAASVHPELKGLRLMDAMPAAPKRRIFIRHTVGQTDPLVDADIAEEDRVNDGEPESLEAYAKRDGLKYFKVKISGDVNEDVARLKRMWDKVLVKVDEPVITLDGNEAYTDLGVFEGFVDRFANEAPGLFEHTLFIEQPLTRTLTLDENSRGAVERLSKRKDLVIDEADGSFEAFPTAFGLGYAGTSHKNCKGVFKSLLNQMLCRHYEVSTGRRVFMSGEDLSNLPMVPLHQDFAVVGALGIGHCERNGHHYGFGLSHLTQGEKERVTAAHPDLYVQRGDEWFLNIVDGAVDVSSILLKPGLGGDVDPDWESLAPLEEWRA